MNMYGLNVIAGLNAQAEQTATTKRADTSPKPEVTRAESFEPKEYKRRTFGPQAS